MTPLKMDWLEIVFSYMSMSTAPNMQNQNQYTTVWPRLQSPPKLGQR